MIDLTSFIALTIEKRKLQAELRNIQEVLDEQEPQLITKFQEAGIQSIKQNGYLAYLSSRVWAKCEFPDMEKISDEWPSLISLQQQRAGSLLSELLARDDKEGLAQLALAGITPNEITKLNIKKG